MHIALCDNNIADRKQMERLLTRESDKRIRKGNTFYIDSYGSYQALLDNPLIYDAYFLDVTDPAFTAYDIAKALRNNGIASPVVYCISTIDYHKTGELLPNSVFLNKPIKVDELSLVLDEIMLQQKEHHVPKIELRNHNETFYLEEKDVLYFTGEGRSITVHMTDGSIKEAIDFVDNLWQYLTPFPSFFLANKTTIVNTRYVAEVSLLSITMKNQDSIKINPTIKKDIKKLMALYK